MGMTAKQERFCQEYVVDLNGTQAAIRAGYCKTGARQTACVLLTNPNIQKKVEFLQAEIASSLEITAERVLRELARLAFADLSEIVKIGKDGRVKVTPTEQMTEDQRRAIQSVSQTADGIKVKFADKLRALELVGKHIGLFVERIEIQKPRESEGLTEAQLLEIVNGDDQQA